MKSCTPFGARGRLRGVALGTGDFPWGKGAPRWPRPGIPTRAAGVGAESARATGRSSAPPGWTDSAARPNTQTYMRHIRGNRR